MALKIALVSPYDFPYPGGVSEHIVALANGLRQRGHQVQILAACSGFNNNQQRDSHTHAVAHTITKIPVGGAVARVGLSPLSYLRIKKILQHEAFDVIHLQEPLTPSITWLVLMQAHIQPNAITVGTFHAYHEKPNWFYKQGRPLFKKFFARLDSLIAVSNAARRFAHQMFPGHYHIIPNGIDLNRFGREIGEAGLAETNQKSTILFVGRLDKRKGFAHLFEAFLQIKPRYPHLCLQVVGPFNAKACANYQKMAQARNITDVEFIGYASPEQLPKFYHRADIFCAPSIGFESFGMVLLEAMAAGLPIVASDIAGYRALVTHGKEGLLVPPGQPRVLAQALAEMLETAPQRWRMARHGQAKAGQYSWDCIVDKTLKVYQDTIQSKMSVEPKLFFHPGSVDDPNGHTERRQTGYVKRSRTQI